MGVGQSQTQANNENRCSTILRFLSYRCRFSSITCYNQKTFSSNQKITTATSKHHSQHTRSHPSQAAPGKESTRKNRTRPNSASSKRPREIFGPREARGDKRRHTFCKDALLSCWRKKGGLYKLYQDACLFSFCLGEFQKNRSSDQGMVGRFVPISEGFWGGYGFPLLSALLPISSKPFDSWVARDICHESMFKHTYQNCLGDLWNNPNASLDYRHLICSVKAPKCG